MDNAGYKRIGRSRRVMALPLAGLSVVAAAGAIGAAYYRRPAVSQLLRRAAHRIEPGLRAALRPDSNPGAAAADTLPERADAPLVLYRHGLGDGWQDWSWATHDIDHRGAGGVSDIRMVPAGWKAVYLHHDTFRTDGYGSLQLSIRGHAALMVAVADADGKFGRQFRLPSGGADWTVCRVPLADLGVARAGDSISGIAIQDATGGSQGAVEIDDVMLMPDPTLPAAPTSATVAVVVNARADRHPISRDIYGMAFAPPDYLTDLRLAVNRWGGNDKSRYNWALGNACNAARDWNFANRKAVDAPDIGDAPSSAADAFIRDNRKAGAQTLLTVPTIGWVAKNADNACASQNVPATGGDPLTDAGGAIQGYDPTANRRLTSVRSVARQSAAAQGDVAQDAWVRHLAGAFGAAGHGGVRFYAMDNEPDLWDVTHTDVHPARMGYDDVLRNFLDYATAVKAADPTAQVTGPVVSGWTGYFYSALDRGSDNFHTHADRTRHGGAPFLPWFLTQVRQHDQRTGRRTLDVLDVHYYPQAQGVYSAAADRATQELRLRETRSLWDPAYQDESWIGDAVRLIPRLKEWVAAAYPGTKIGVTEWSFGADRDISGGLAVADALGIFGREGLDLACYWPYPAKNEPAYLAFKLYRNADGRGDGFGDISCRAISAQPTRLSAFAAIDHSNGTVTVVLVNQMAKATVTAPITFAGNPSLHRKADVYVLAGSAPQTIGAHTAAVAGGKLTLTLPPFSAALVRIASDAPAVAARTAAEVRP